MGIGHIINNTDCTSIYYILIFLLQIKFMVNTHPKTLLIYLLGTLLIYHLKYY